MGCCSWVKSMDQQYVGILLLFIALLFHKSGLLSCKLSAPDSEHKKEFQGALLWSTVPLVHAPRVNKYKTLFVHDL